MSAARASCGAPHPALRAVRRWITRRGLRRGGPGAGRGLAAEDLGDRRGLRRSGVVAFSGRRDPGPRPRWRDPPGADRDHDWDLRGARGPGRRTAGAAWTASPAGRLGDAAPAVAGAAASPRGLRAARLSPRLRQL